MAVRVYRGSAAEYTTFITPEAWEAMQEWRTVWASDVGRGSDPEDPVFKREGMFPKIITQDAIRVALDRLIRHSGLRKTHGMDRTRRRVPAMHGFRRFWNKTVKDTISDDSPVSSLTKKEYMMGHSGMTAMDRNYHHTNTRELANEYINAVPGLTINGVQPMRLSGHPPEEHAREQEGSNAKIERLERMVNTLSMRLS